MNILNRLKLKKQRKIQEDSIVKLIENVIDAREERGDKSLLDSREIPMLKNLFRLKDVRVHNIMTPRVKIDAVPLDIRPSKFCKYIASEQFTRYPVYDGILDNIVGIVHVKDILAMVVSKKKCAVQDVMTPHFLFVAPTMRVLDLLKEMQNKKLQMAIVVDEYGGVDGLVSLEDLLEVLVGEIEDEHDESEEKKIQRNAHSSIQIDAKILLDQFEKDVCPLRTPEERKNSDIETIGGWVVNLAKHVPQKGEVIHHPPSGLRFLILKSDSCCIKELKVLNIGTKKRT